MQGKADLHIHSCYSHDSFSSLRAILKRAQKKKLDIIAITDHGEIKGAKEAEKIAPQFGIEVIVGEEIKTKEGDLIALFIEEKILSGKPVIDTIKEIHYQGGLAVVPHPEAFLSNGIHFKDIVKISNELDGIEIFNGAWRRRMKREKVESLNKAVFNLAPVGGSDAHLARQVGSGYTLFPGQNKNDLYQAIKKKLTTTAGSSWTFLDRTLWMVNVPRVVISHPKLFMEGVKTPLKNAFFKIKSNNQL